VWRPSWILDARISQNFFSVKKETQLKCIPSKQILLQFVWGQSIAVIWVTLGYWWVCRILYAWGCPFSTRRMIKQIFSKSYSFLYKKNIMYRKHFSKVLLFSIEIKCMICCVKILKTHKKAANFGKNLYFCSKLAIKWINETLKNDWMQSITCFSPVYHIWKRKKYLPHKWVSLKIVTNILAILALFRAKNTHKLQMPAWRRGNSYSVGSTP
jgi:hypothetical protein